MVLLWGRLLGGYQGPLLHLPCLTNGTVQGVKEEAAVAKFTCFRCGLPRMESEAILVSSLCR